VPVVLLDTAKGFVPALVFSLTVSPLAGVLAGSAAMLGHARPLFLKFEKGGKMVATTGGAFLGVAPLVGLVGLGVWIVVFLVTRYASVASIVAALSLPVAAALLGHSWPVIAFAFVAAAAVVVLHRANVKRLLAGTESRFVLRRRRGGPARA
jgi:glycerol-3-phosphate acyltransferase PlsY